MRLVAKIARVRIGDEVWWSGDGILTADIKVTLGEEARASTCQFAINDLGLEIGAKFQDISFKAGGLFVSPELLGAPQQQAAAPAASTPTVADTSSGSGSGKSVNPSSSSSSSHGRGDYQQLWDTMVIKPERMNEFKRLANKYFASSARYEAISRATGIPADFIFVVHIRESDCDFGTHLHNGDSLRGYTHQVPAGRPKVGHGPPFTFEESAIDALKYEGYAGQTNWGIPDLLGRLEKYNGLGYKNKGLNSPYIWGGTNHQQPGKYVADNTFSSTTWDTQPGCAPILKLIRSSAPPPTTPMTNSAAPATGTATATPVTTADTSTEVAVKGTEIIIELGFDDMKKLIAFHFIHVGTESENSSSIARTVFKGQSIRWLLTRMPQNRSFESVTLKQVAETFTSTFKLKLEMEGKGTEFAHLDMSGKTPFKVLHDEAKRIGYTITDHKNTLQLKPAARPSFTNFVVDEDTLISAKFGDQARGGTPSGGATTSEPQTPAGDAKTAINQKTGQIETLSPDKKAGTDQAPGQKGLVTGAAARPPHGIVKSTATRQAQSATTTATSQSSQSTSSVTTSQKEENPKTTTKPTEEVKSPDGTVLRKEESEKVFKEAEKLTTTKVTTLSKKDASGKVTSTMTKTEEKVSTKDGSVITTTINNNGHITKSSKKTTETYTEPSADSGGGMDAPENSSTGALSLPNQPPGRIDLEDGRAEPQALVDEKMRSKGFESSVVLLMTEETLQLVPGEIIALSGRLFPPPWNREWRIAQVVHDFNATTVSLSIYTPQAPLQPATPAPTSAAPTAAAEQTPDAQTPTPTGWIMPCPGPCGDGFGPRPGRPPGYRHRILDIRAPNGTPVVAMNDGVVIETVTHCTVGDHSCGGGWGNYVLVQHGGGYYTRYCHLSVVKRDKGPVKRGEVVGNVGNTGHSFGDHLHLDVRKGGPMGEIVLCSQLGLTVLGEHRAGFQY